MFGFDGCVISFEKVVSFCKHHIVFWSFQLLLRAVCELLWKSQQWMEKCAKAIEKNCKWEEKWINKTVTLTKFLFYYLVPLIKTTTSVFNYNLAFNKHTFTGFKKTNLNSRSTYLFFLELSKLQTIIFFHVHRLQHKWSRTYHENIFRRITKNNNKPILGPF